LYTTLDVDPDSQRSTSTEEPYRMWSGQFYTPLICP
jgi:hypothetical protein